MEGISDAAYSRWIDTEWWEDGYERLWNSKEVAAGAEDAQTSGESSKLEEETSDATNGKKSLSKHKKPQTASQEKIVYLTADSSEELTELREDETYIIGGIVDHNRYKNLCLKKSEDSKIRSARLPIGTYLSELKTRKVLTVNQTFEILLKWVETRNWEQALYAVVPKRKFDEKGGGDGTQEGTQSDKVVFEAEEVEEGRLDEDASKNTIDDPKGASMSLGNTPNASA